jgi:SAM-dependent methyltransferase
MAYQPVNIDLNFITKLKEQNIDLEKLYELLDLNNVERNCLDRLGMIINDIKSSNNKVPSVLDLGCNGGFFSIGLATCAAGSVVGVDDDRYIKIQGEDLSMSIKEANKRIEKLGVHNVILINEPIEYYIFNRYLFDKYDTVLCLNILHHFYKGYGNLTSEGKLESDAYRELLIKLGQMINHSMYFETNAAFFPNYETALIEIMTYCNFTKLHYLGVSPAADGELRILWKFQK